MESLESRLASDLKDAMKAGEKVRVGTIRQLRSQIQYAKLDAGERWSDDDALGVLAKAAKMREESIAQFEKGNRPDLVEKERDELRIIEGYLPRQLTVEELDAIVVEVIAEAHATGPGDMGAVMKAVMPRVKGRADGKVVSDRVRQGLAGGGR